MRRELLQLLAGARGLLRLRADTDEEGAISQISANVEFRGGNFWALVLAIVIASVGLNVNSTAVIIGAMLISPLMGPIMGAGLGLGINDVALLRRSVRNLAIAASASVGTSALYFLVSPLAEAQSELLARTRPTIYDVLIALTGGFAGIVAATRRGDRGNVIPGVAIATALMPPLCTAGFGLANGDLRFFLGALYLFLINSVFICLATLVGVRLLHFGRVVDLDPAHARRMRLLITAATVLTLIPSVYVAWRVIQESRFESAARRYVAENLVFPDRSVVNTSIHHSRDSSTIETTLLGRPLPTEMIESLRQRMTAYGLRRTRLVIHEPVEATIAPEQLGQVVRAGILEDLYKRNEAALTQRDARIGLLEGEIVRLRSQNLPMADVVRELGTLYPGLRSLLHGTAFRTPDKAGRTDSAATVATVVAGWQRVPGRTDQERIRAFLRSRLQVESLQVQHVLEH